MFAIFYQPYRAIFMVVLLLFFPGYIFSQNISSLNNSIPVEANIGSIGGPAGATLNLEIYSYKTFQVKNLPWGIKVPKMDWKVGIGRWSGRSHDVRFQDQYFLTGISSPIFTLNSYLLFGEAGFGCHILSAEHTIDNPSQELQSTTIRYGPRFSFGVRYQSFKNLTPSILMGFDLVDRANTFFINTQIRSSIPAAAYKFASKIIRNIGL